MLLVVDANVLFSALIKDSFTAELIFDETLELYTAEFIIEEFLKYEGLILRKTHRTKGDLVTVMHQVNGAIKVVPQKEYSKFMERA